MGRQRKTNPSLLVCSTMEMEIQMNDIHRVEADLVSQRDVITLCDYESRPTIKSSNEINTVIVVKSDENLHSIEAGTNRERDNHYKSLENRAVGGAHQ